MQHYFELFALGIVIGTVGTMIGAGGGFVLAPILLLMYPGESTDTIASISLAVTCVNAISGSVAYGRMGRISYKYGIIFAVAAIPGAITGAMATHYVSRRHFDLAFAAILIVLAIWLLWKGSPPSATDHRGPVRLTSGQLVVGILASVAVGALSSFLGIGGGIIHVPLLANVLDFPVHMATATSHFILAIVALVGTCVHVATGTFEHGIRRAIAAGFGVLIGAQIGARFSSRVHGHMIIRCLAGALLFVGARLLVLSFHGG